MCGLCSREVIRPATSACEKLDIKRKRKMDKRMEIEKRQKEKVTKGFSVNFMIFPSKNRYNFPTVKLCKFA